MDTRTDIRTPSAPRAVSLALQGGGSHGAFTWGVLDTLLTDRRLAIEGISGASAGALNAVALAHGYAIAGEAGQDPREAARSSLARIWGEVGALGRPGELHRNLSSLLWSGLPPGLAPTSLAADAFSRMFSPYQANPLDINPLRSLLAREIDFEAIARQAERPGGLRVFVSATHVNSGKAVIFSGHRLTAQAVAASACLPMLFQAVEIDGERYWDGGYSGNPDMRPLIRHCDSADLVLVQINPVLREHPPQTADEIASRASELTFNASLLAQMRGIHFINRLLAEGALSPSRCKSIHLHRIDSGTAIQQYPASSRASTDPAMIRALFALGAQSATDWLAQHFESLGRRSTVDVRRDYLDSPHLADLHPDPDHPPTPGTPGTPAAPQPTSQPSGAISPAYPGRRANPWRTWLARLFARLRPGRRSKS